MYVPSLYDVEYNEDGTVKAYIPHAGVPKTIRKRVCNDVDNMYFPENFVVPFLDIVHDRAVVEVLRGCIRGCRFCQAGFLYRPFREKSVETINRQAKRLCETTGYDEISLSSLSTSDYSRLFELLDTLHTCRRTSASAFLCRPCASITSPRSSSIKLRPCAKAA